MNTIALETFTGDWRALVAGVEHSGEPAILTLDDAPCGLLLPAHIAARLAARYASAPAPTSAGAPPAAPTSAYNYLELLRDDPTLVPVVDGQPLEFVTMMNSSYIDPQQLYQFKHPLTRQIYMYRASELQQAIGRTFVSVDFVPAHPRDFVDGKRG